ncbi:MAG: AAA family ATPase [Cryomorphaceae bacterium]|nr:MAG: AAA family ATPase [Cryomorphaceae bacterium]
MQTVLEQLYAQHNKLVKSTSVKFVRSLMGEINWNARLIGIKGPRGVGKTTLLLQYIKLKSGKQAHALLYVSMDSILLANCTLMDLVDSFEKYGGKILFVDEVHRYPNWSEELKNIYDAYPDLKIVFTGSSLLDILNARADLSRRAVVYELQGLSFREYLALQTGEEPVRISLTDALNHHHEVVPEIIQSIKPLAHFGNYLAHGYFPFYYEQPDLYYMKLREVVNMILEIELPLLRGVDISYVHRIKQLLYILSQSVPFVPNVSGLSAKMGMQRITLLSYLHYLDEVKLTRNLFKETKGISKLQKPLKIYPDNTNLMYALSGEGINTGSLRETFFANQLSYSHRLQYPGKGDFLVDERYTFEIGGKGKDFMQLEGIQEAYIAADNIEYGFKNKIPLWLFGFLY